MFWTPRLCRICSAVGEISYPIFSTINNDIEDKLKKCLSINVYKDDFKPKEICNNCLDKLNNYCLFLDLCVASNNKFESILYQTNRSESQDNWTNYKLGSDLFSPTDAGVIVKTDADLLLSSSIDLNESREVINDISFEQNQTVLRHSSEFYKNNVEIELEKNFTNENFNYSENYYTVEDKNESKSNKNENKPKDKLKPFSCHVCNRQFMRKLTLRAHIASHTNVKPFQCDTCDKSYPLQGLLTRHKITHSSTFQCEYCSKSFPAASKLELHLRVHTKERPFKCDFDGCNKIFADKRNLVRHKVTHSKDRNFLCDICKKCFKTKNEVKDHQKAHTEGSYACDVCSKVYKWRANLATHKKKHKEFSCKKCNISFKVLSLFLIHKNECAG